MVSVTTRPAANTSESNAILALPIEQERAVGRHFDADLLVNAAREVLVGTNCDEAVAGVDAAKKYSPVSSAE